MVFNVCGITFTSKIFLETLLIVKDTPFIDIEPLCAIYEPSLLQNLKENPEVIEKMSPQMTLKKMKINIVKPKSDRALYNLNRITPEIANVIDIE